VIVLLGLSHLAVRWAPQPVPHGSFYVGPPGPRVPISSQSREVFPQVAAVLCSALFFPLWLAAPWSTGPFVVFFPFRIFRRSPSSPRGFWEKRWAPFRRFSANGFSCVDPAACTFCLGTWVRAFPLSLTLRRRKPRFFLGILSVWGVR